MTMKNAISQMARILVLIVFVLSLTATAHAAVPGITGPTFNLTAQDGYLNQPDGEAIYSWGYGCSVAPTGFAPAALASVSVCPTMQVPGPTLIVHENDRVTINLVNQLPTAAGNTSILFPGFQVTASGGVVGLLTHEAAPGQTVTYTFTASQPGTHSYYSGTQGDLQIEMGLYGAVVVLPATVPANCTSGYHSAIVAAKVGCTAGTTGCSLNVQTEPYHPAYFIINGRSMPDLMDPNYASEYPHQPYNADPHTHPGDLLLIRTIGQGRWQHPFHEHANHVRILARDANLELSSSTTPVSYSTPGGTAVSGPGLAGLLMFNTDTTPGESFDGVFYYTGRGLNWDPYGHHPVSSSNDPLATLSCTPDANGYNTTATTAVNFFEWCQDHNKPVEVNPFGDVGAGGPITLPDPDVFTNGQWYGGTPYLGPDASLRAQMPTCVGSPNGTPNPTTPSGGAGTPPVNTANCTTLNPANTQLNPANERGWAFMWHSHNEREITTNNVFPGGMLMMLLVDSREFVIDETL